MYGLRLDVLGGASSAVSVSVLPGEVPEGAEAVTVVLSLALAAVPILIAAVVIARDHR